MEQKMISLKNSKLRVVFLWALSMLINNVSLIGASNSYIYLPDKIIQEEISIGSLVVDVSKQIAAYRQTKDNQEFSGEIHQFAFLDDHKSSTENTYFLLDSVTGQVTSKRYLDRESMCINKHCANTCESTNSHAYILDYGSKSKNGTNNSLKLGNCDMNLKILVIPSYNIVSLNIIIQDINDNKPQFRIGEMVESVPENVPIGYQIPIDFAYDPDTGLNSIQYYSLVQTELIKNTFELVYGESQLFLVVKQKLDRETISQYNLTISACDGGIPSNCGNLKLIINIIDINDHNPVFLKEVYTFSVLEDQKPGSVIGQINAFDSDEGVNSHIKYSIIGSNPNSMEKNNLLRYFNLDPNTGLLLLKTSLDYEKKQFFSFSIEAKDGGVGSLPAYTKVEIIVVDVNDNSPEISVSFLNSLSRNTSENSSVQNLYINENYEANKFIAHVSISDRDLGARLQWKVLMNEKVIESSIQAPDSLSNVISVNKLNENSFTINTGSQSNTLLDREKTPQVRISIVSWDGIESSDKSNKAEYNFVLILIDENDNSPQFDKPAYEFSIMENNQVGDFINQFKAVDLDSGKNGQVQYSVEYLNTEDLNDKDFLNVDASTGILRASKKFDREAKSVYEFNVIARDQSPNKQLFSTVKCLLRILDKNDNEPVISYSNDEAFKVSSNESDLVLKVDENIPILTKLVQFRCRDDDLNDNGRVDLKLMSRSDYDLTHFRKNLLFKIPSKPILNEIPFKISNDGYLYVSKKLDREADDTYDVILMCKDQAREEQAQNRTLNIRIKLNDINDNCPRSLEVTSDIKKKSKFFNKDKIDLDQIDKSLFLIDYTDADTGSNGELSFELLNHQDIFKLEPVRNEHVYSLNIKFSQNSSMSSVTKQAFIDHLKLGHYLIQVKISDDGFPSCIKTDSFRLYLGSNDIKTEEILIVHLKEAFRSPEDAISYYVNDKDDFKADQSSIIKNNFSLNQLQSRNGTKARKSFLDIFTKDDYVILLSLIVLLISASSFLSIVGCVYFFKNSSDDKRLKKLNKSRNDMLKIKNYCEIEVNDSSLNTSNSQEDDGNSQTEINNLLEHDAILNRFSVSLKSSNPEQSTSADSVMSNLTYAREMTISNTSQNSDDQSCQRPRAQIYSDPSKQHSTFLSQKYQSNSSPNNNSSSFKPSNLSPNNKLNNNRSQKEQSSESNVPLLSSFPNQYSLKKQSPIMSYHQQKSQRIYLSKKEMLDNLNNNHSPQQNHYQHHNEALSTTDSEIMILPSTISNISSPATSTSASSDCELYSKRQNMHFNGHETRIRYNEIKNLNSSSEDEKSCTYNSSSTQGSMNSNNNNQSTLNKINRSYLRSSAV